MEDLSTTCPLFFDFVLDKVEKVHYIISMSKMLLIKL